MTATKSEESVAVGLGEMQVSSDPAVVLTCLGLGSCIGLSAYDAQANVAGMIHIVLPSSNGRDEKPSPKYADTAIPLLVEEMVKHGASKRRLVIKIVGGAQMSNAPGASSLFKMGEKNAVATKAALSAEGLRIAAADIGGSHGRTFRLNVKTGNTTVASAGSGAKDI